MTDKKYPLSLQWHSSGEITHPASRAGHFTEPEAKVPDDFPTRRVILGFRRLSESSLSPSLPSPSDLVIQLALSLLQAVYSAAQRVRITVDQTDMRLKIIGAKDSRPPMLTSAYPGEDGGILLLVEFGEHEIELRVEPDQTITLSHDHDGEERAYTEGMTEEEAVRAITEAWDAFLWNLSGSSTLPTSMHREHVLHPRHLRIMARPPMPPRESLLWTLSALGRQDAQYAPILQTTTPGSGVTGGRFSADSIVPGSLPLTA